MIEKSGNMFELRKSIAVLILSIRSFCLAIIRLMLFLSARFGLL